jgi:hypothetical protein
MTTVVCITHIRLKTKEGEGERNQRQKNLDNSLVVTNGIKHLTGILDFLARKALKNPGGESKNWPAIITSRISLRTRTTPKPHHSKNVDKV